MPVRATRFAHLSASEVTGPSPPSVRSSPVESITRSPRRYQGENGRQHWEAEARLPILIVLVFLGCQLGPMDRETA